MMKKGLLLFLLLLIGWGTVQATHFAGGDCYYDYVSATPGDNTRARYAVHYIFYRDIQGAAFNATSITVGMYDASPTSVSGVVEVLRTVPQFSRQLLNQYSPGCFYKSPIGYERVEFIDTVDLLRTKGYFFSTSNFARNGGQIQNISQTGPFSIVLSTYVPPRNSFVNNSPRFRAIPVPYSCVGKKYVYNHDGFDLDGDSLAFNIVWPYGQGGTYRSGGNVGEGGIPDFNISTLPLAQRSSFPTRPTLPGNNTGISGYYTPVTYQGAYSFPSSQVPAISPDTLKIDGQTGEISFTPVNQGGFVVAVECSEYRVDRVNNTVTYLGSSRRDLQFFFDANCSSNNAPQIMVTDSFTIKVGDTLDFNASGIEFDPTRDTVIMSISGDIVGAGSGKASVTITPGPSQAVMNIRWIPNCTYARTAPYFLIITAKDNLCAVNQKTVYLQVLPKSIISPPQNLNCSSKNGGLKLTWSNSFSNGIDFSKYLIYRKIDQAPFQLIDSISQFTQLSYFDSINYSNNNIGSISYCMIGVNTCGEIGKGSDTTSFIVHNIFSSLPDTLSACGKSAILDAGNYGANFLWNTGETTQQITVAQSGWYHVTISTQTNSLRDSVYVDLLSVDLGNDTAICAGNQLNIVAQIRNEYLKGFFDGNRYIKTIGNGPSGQNQRTYSFWINTLDSSAMSLLFHGDYSTGTSYSDFMLNLDLWFGAGSGGCNQYKKGVSYLSISHAATFAKTVYDGKWHHIVYSMGENNNFSHSNIAVYVDGILVSRPNNSIPYCGHNWGGWTYNTVATPMKIGAAGGRSSSFKGDLSKIAIWDRALNIQEVNQVFNHGVFAASSNLKNYYPLDKIVNDSIVLDEISGNHGIMNGSTYSPSFGNLGMPISYLWSTGDTTPSINVSPTRTTTYYCTVSNGITTCTDSIVVTVGGPSQANLFSDTTSGCGSVVLSAGNNATAYLWNTGDTTSTILVKQSGWYGVTVGNGTCLSFDSTYVDLLSVDLGNDTAICAGETVKLTSNIVSNNTPFFASNDTIENYNNFIFTALDTTSGKYRIWTKSSFQSDYQPIFTDQYHRSHPIPSQDQKELIYVRYKRNILYPSSNPIRNATMDSSWICKSNIDGTNEQILFIIPNFNRDCIFSLDWSYDKTRILLNKGNDAYPNLTRDGDIFEYNLGTNQLVNITNNWDIMEWGIAKYAPGTYDFYYTPSGTGWYANDGQIYKYNRSSNTRSVIIPNSNSAVIGISSDGTNLYYRKGGYPNLYQKNLSTGIETSIIQNPGIGGNEMSANLYFDVAKSNFSPKNAIRLIKNSAAFNQLIIPQVKDFELDGNAISYNVSTLATDAIWLGKWTTSQIKLLWSTGDTTPTINVSPTRTTTYYCTVSNGISTCTDSIVVTVGGSKQVNLFNDTTSGCGSVNLSAGNNATSYLWNTGDTTSTILVKQSGWYGVTVGNGTCLSFDSTYVDILSVDLGNDTAICAGETYLINPFVKGNPNLKNGLMAAYSFDGNAYDFSGNGNHGKPRGVTPTTDRFGNPNGAYFFRGFGNNDHVFVPNHPSMHIDSVYTMSLWYKEIPGNAMNGVGAYSPTNGTAALFAKEGDGIGTPPGFFADINYNANGGYSLNYLQVDGCCGVRSKFQAQFSHPMQVDSTWKHVVIVNTKDYAETYINGVKVKFASMPSTFLAANRNNLYFGTYGYGKQSPFWYPFYGSMDEVFMYNRALDSNEISALYQLQNSQNQFTYTWSNGATTPYIGVTPAQTTTYYCTVSNGITSCVDSVTITVKPNPPVVTLPDTLFQCGNPGRLDAGNPGATYLWSNKSTTQSILPVNGGWYSVVVNQNGCTATDSSYVDLLTLDLGRDTSICIGSSITLSVQGQNLGNTTPDSIFVPTDASWKVSVLNPEGWEFVGFNDTNSFWPSARIQGTSNISGAQPIWHPDGTGVYDAYFRKVFEVNGQPNTDFQLEVSAENEYYAFVNGRFVGYGNSSMGAKQTYPIAQNLIQGYNSIAIFASNWGVSTAQLSALITGTTDKKSYLWTTGDTTSSITVAPTQTTTYYCTVTNGYTFCTDSMVVRVGTPQAISIQGTTCSNQPYVFGGRMISQPGVYVDSLRSSFGCDSVVTLSLNVNSISVDSISAKVCGNSTYIFGGQALTQSGIYMDTLQNSLGCDSFVVLDLQFAQPDTQRINTAICNGSSYAFNGQNLTQPGVYQTILTNSQGCDSVIILTLNVNASPVITVNDSICRGQVYSFGGQLYSNSGQYSFTSVSQSGCTTTVVLNLVVNEIQKAVITANGPLEFCGNGSVSFAASTGRSYLWSTGARTSSIQVRQSNSIWVEVTDFNGCVSRSDSQVVIQRLTVPTRPDTIIGFMNPCGIRGTNNLATYSVARDSNATSYLWMLTDGIVAVGRADSDVIQVLYPADYTTGQIRVTPQNACGSGVPRAIYPRTGKPTNAPIVSQADIAVCAIRGTGNTATYSVFQADGCNGYLWTVPRNATLVSGQGTTSIQVMFASTFTSGRISVVGLSPCGNTNSRSISVNLLPKPVISGPNVLCPGDTATFSIPSVPNATRYRFNLPAGLVLVSQNLNTAVIRNSGSFISGSLGAQYQTLNCGWSQPGAYVVNTVACRSVANESLSIAIYPNPSRGEFQLQLGTMVSNIQVSLYSSDGRLVKREMLSPVEIQTLNYQNLAEGLYHLEVVATDLNQQVVRHLEKLMIQR